MNLESHIFFWAMVILYGLAIAGIAYPIIKITDWVDKKMEVKDDGTPQKTEISWW